MKNVTISMDEKLVRKARVTAAGRGESLSKYVSRLVQRELGMSKEARMEALRGFLDGPGFQSISDFGGKPLREALYEERTDELIRRRERAALRDRSE